MNLFRRFSIIFGGIFFLMSAQHIVRFLAQPADIWWTPEALGVPLADGSDRVQIYISGVSLREHIGAGRLQLLTFHGAAPVTESETRLRFNNWDRVRSQNVAVLLGSAACLGASGVILLVGLLGWGPGKAGR
jgi:hypothetical protein